MSVTSSEIKAIRDELKEFRGSRNFMLLHKLFQLLIIQKAGEEDKLYVKGMKELLPELEPLKPKSKGRA